MNLRSLLGGLPPSEFINEYFHKLPYSSAGTAMFAREFGTWEVVMQLITATDADVMIVRDGQRFSGPPPRTKAAAIGLSQAGYTILVRHAERHHEGLRQLAHRFRADLGAPVDVHMYATPPGRHGFFWHYDAEDVFILQAAGEKEYSLRKNSVHPWPLVETIPSDMRYEREIMPLMKVLLHRGDWLYIPCGYWHKAEACQTAEPAISLALGVMSPSAIALYDFLRPKLIESLVWRQRLPMGLPSSGDDADSTTEPEDQVFKQICQQLADDFASSMNDAKTAAEFRRWLRNGGVAASDDRDDKDNAARADETEEVPPPPDRPQTDPQREPPQDEPAPVKRAPDAPTPDDPKHVVE